MTPEIRFTYQEVPDARLFTTLNFNFKEEIETKEKIRNKWVKERKCSCCFNKKILCGDEVLTCEHIKTEWRNKMSELDNKINKKVKILVMRRLKGCQDNG